MRSRPGWEIQATFGLRGGLPDLADDSATAESASIFRARARGITAGIDSLVAGPGEKRQQKKQRHRQHARTTMSTMPEVVVVLRRK